MLRSTLILCFLIVCSAVRAQAETMILIPMIGFGGGLPVFRSIEAQNHGVDLITQSRDHSTQLQIGMQFNTERKNMFEVFFKRTRFSFDRVNIAEEYRNRFPEQHFYPRYSKGNGGQYPWFNLHSLNCNYGREMGNSKVSIFPYVGVGVGLWTQRDFFFILRDKDSNFGTEYFVSMKKTVRPTYTLGARFGISRFPTVHLDLSIHGGPNTYTYDVRAFPQDPNEISSTSVVSYKRMVQSVNLVLVVELIDI